MNIIRTIVSGKKNRFQEEGYNLDLTYVCPRIVAMAFPAQGIEGIYRNHIDKVAELIVKRHGLNYLVFNLSGRSYNYSKFNDRVLGFEWEDHHSPPLHTLFHICQQIHQFLKGDIERIVLIHCLAGKGRTGTIICCYLLFCGRLKTVQETLQYYGKKRFHSEGLGVNQPCQIRYIQYFHRMLQGDPIYPTIKYIRRITFDGRPKFNLDGGCKPSLSIIHVATKKELYNQKRDLPQPRKFAEGQAFQINLLQPVPLCGDFVIKINNIGMIKDTQMMRLSLNSAFVPNNKSEQIYLPVDIDPSQITTDERFPPQFALRIEFDNLCKCNSQTPYDKKCEICYDWVQKEKNSWEIIDQILAMYKDSTVDEQSILLFGDLKLDDIVSVLASQDWVIIQDKENHSYKKEETKNFANKDKQQILE